MHSMLLLQEIVYALHVKFTEVHYLKRFILKTRACFFYCWFYKLMKI